MFGFLLDHQKGMVKKEYLEISIVALSPTPFQVAFIKELSSLIPKSEVL